MRKYISEILVSVIFCCIAVFLYAEVGVDLYKANPTIPPLDCTSYSPYIDDINDTVSQDVITADLKKIKEYTSCIRIYSTKNGLYAVPAIADKLGMKVLLGAWIDKASQIENQKQIEIAATLANAHESVLMIVVGNEVINNGGWTKTNKETFLKYIEYLRAHTKEPLAIAAFSGPLLREYDLLDKVDVIGLHIFPYWDGVDLKQNPDYIVDKYERFKAEMNKKGIRSEVAILEYGTPWLGLDRIYNTPNLSDQRAILNETTQKLKERGVFSNFYELFTEKRINDADGFLFRLWGTLTNSGENLVTVQRTWYMLLSVIILILIVFESVIFIRYKRQRKSFLNKIVFLLNTITVYVLSGYGIYIIHSIYGDSYWIRQIGFSLIIVLGLRVYMRSIGELCYEAEGTVSEKADIIPSTFVSVHIPSAHERLDLLKKTLTSVLTQTFQNFEIVFVNNGDQTVEYEAELRQLCASFDDDRLKYIYFENPKKNKGAVLQHALLNTDAKATHVFVLDADYQLVPEALQKSLEKCLPEVDVVSYPQAYHTEKNFIPHMAEIEQRCVEYISQPFRALSNSLILNGTLCLIRIECLRDYSWDDETVCEDAMLGMELQMGGKNMVYVPERIGTGLAPQSVKELCNQRLRWVIGAMQVLKRIIINGIRSPKIAWAYVIGWLPWIGTLLIVPLTVMYIAYATETATYIHVYLMHLPIFTHIYIMVLAIAVMNFFRLKNRLGLSIWEMIKFILFEVSIVTTVCIGVIVGVLFKNKTFITTRSGKSLVYGLNFVISFGMSIILIYSLISVIKRSLYLTSWVTIFNSVVPILLVLVPYLAFTWLILFTKAYIDNSKK